MKMKFFLDFEIGIRYNVLYITFLREGIRRKKRKKEKCFVEEIQQSLLRRFVFGIILHEKLGNTTEKRRCVREMKKILLKIDGKREEIKMKKG